MNGANGSLRAAPGNSEQHRASGKGWDKATASGELPEHAVAAVNGQGNGHDNGGWAAGPGDAGLTDHAEALLVRKRPWAPRFWAQFRALFKKNLLVSARNLRATVLRVLAPL